jgi:hypothetical protein
MPTIEKSHRGLKIKVDMLQRLNDARILLFLSAPTASQSQNLLAYGYCFNHLGTIMAGRHPSLLSASTIENISVGKMVD